MSTLPYSIVRTKAGTKTVVGYAADYPTARAIWSHCENAHADIDAAYSIEVVTPEGFPIYATEQV